MPAAISALAPGLGFAQETVDISLPPSVTFWVDNVSVSTTGSPNPTTATFSNADLTTGRALRIGVKAEATNFSPPSGTAIAASKVSWTMSNAQGGAGFNGSLSATSYTQLFQSNTSPTSGGVDLTWKLEPPGPGIRAGNHSLTLRWKLESVVP